MVNDIVNLLENDYSKDNLSIRLPDAFDRLRGKDTLFEQVVSPTIQCLTMIYSHNVVTRTIGAIFVSDHCRGAKYKNVEQRGNSAIELLCGILEFKEVEVYHNKSKREIIEVMNRLNAQAASFARELEEKDENRSSKVEVVKAEMTTLFKEIAKDKEELTEKEAYELSVKLRERLNRPKISVVEFREEFAKIDYDGDGKLTLKELIDCEVRQLFRKDLLLIGICWIGRCVDDETTDPHTGLPIL